MKDNMDTNQDINADDVEYQYVDDNTQDNQEQEHEQDENENKDKDEDLEADNSEADDEQDEQGENEPKKSRFENRIDKKHREAMEQKERADKLEQELSFWKQQAQDREAKPKTELIEPDILNYDDTEQFKKDYAKYARDLAKQEIEQEKQNISYQANFQKTVEEAKKITDYDAVIAKANSYGVVSSDLLTQAIFESEQGALLPYELAKNPIEAVRISKLAITNPVAFGKEIAKLEARINASKSLNLNDLKKQKPVPPSALNQGSSKNQYDTGNDFMKMSMDEYMNRGRGKK